MTMEGAALGVQGFVHSKVRRLASIQLTLVQHDVRVTAKDHIFQNRMIDPQISSALEANGAAGLDGGFYVSAIFAHDAALRAGLATVEALLTWKDGGTDELRLCFANVDRVFPVTVPSLTGTDPLVGIAMATYNPEPALFLGQIESLRAQTHDRWVCVISDDGSNAKSLENIKHCIANDPRFVLVPNNIRLGVYRNFERALASLPRECRYIAFSDQDDVWKPDRLSAGLRTFEDDRVECIYSDMEVVHSSGRRLSPSFWVHRRPQYGSLAGLMLANVATGMVMLFRRELTPIILPFPATPNLTFHDSWIALIMESRKSLRYVPIALVDYVQHGGNHTGALTPPEPLRVTLRRNIRRLYDIITIPLMRPPDADRIKALLTDMAYWGDVEPVRMRILAHALRTRMPGRSGSRSHVRLRTLVKRFGILAMLRADVDWHDRYRRSVAVALIIGGVTERIVLAYAGYFRRRLRHS